MTQTLGRACQLLASSLKWAQGVCITVYSNHRCAIANILALGQGFNTSEEKVKQSRCKELALQVNDLSADEVTVMFIIPNPTDTGVFGFGKILQP